MVQLASLLHLKPFASLFKHAIVITKAMTLSFACLLSDDNGNEDDYEDDDGVSGVSQQAP